MQLTTPHIATLSAFPSFSTTLTFFFFIDYSHFYNLLDVGFHNTCCFCIAILYLTANFLSLASLDTSKILVIAPMLIACIVKHSHFVKGLVQILTLFAFVLTIILFVGMWSRGHDHVQKNVVYVEEKQGILLVILVASFIRPSSRKSCLVSTCVCLRVRQIVSTNLRDHFFANMDSTLHLG